MATDQTTPRLPEAEPTEEDKRWASEVVRNHAASKTTIKPPLPVHWDRETGSVTQTPVAPREKRWDALRNSADLYGAMHHVIAALAAYHLTGAAIDRHIAAHLAHVAAKVLPHLPSPAENANVW